MGRLSASALALTALLLCTAGRRAEATVTDGALQAAITQAMKTVLSPQIMAPTQQAFTSVQAGLSTLQGSLASAYTAAAAQAEAAISAFESKYCTPATFIPSKKIPAKFVGHSMSITFSLGDCTFNESKWLHDDVKELICTEPSIIYVKTPANFTSKYHSAPAFISKECKVEKTFGEAVSKVLFVFDGQQAPDINSLTAKITEEVKNILGTVQGGAQDLINGFKTGAETLVSGARHPAGGLFGSMAAGAAGYS